MNTYEKCNKILLALLGSPELVTKWWLSPNKAFDMQTPQSQPLEKVYDYLINQAYY